MNDPLESPVKSRRCPEKSNSNDERARVQLSIARGYDDLANGRVRPWKQAKAEADRMRAIR